VAAFQACPSLALQGAAKNKKSFWQIGVRINGEQQKL